MTPRRSAERGNPAVAAAAEALAAAGVPKAGTGKAQAADDARPGHCVSCGKTVDPMTPVSHGLRGGHTCTDPAGVIPPYLDPQNVAERGATDIYRAARDGARHAQATAAALLAAEQAQAEEARKAAQDPGRPFE